MSPGSDRTSMGPERTIGARFPLSCVACRERSRPKRKSGKMRNCRNVLYGARAKRVLVCRTSHECGRFRKRDYGKKREECPGRLDAAAEARLQEL